MTAGKTAEKYRSVFSPPFSHDVALSFGIIEFRITVQTMSKTREEHLYESRGTETRGGGDKGKYP